MTAEPQTDTNTDTKTKDPTNDQIKDQTNDQTNVPGDITKTKLPGPIGSVIDDKDHNSNPK
jgi:hypothetical protein